MNRSPASSRNGHLGVDGLPRVIGCAKDKWYARPNTHSRSPERRTPNPLETVEAESPHVGFVDRGRTGT
jgi:hypothetical protein